MTSNPDTDCDPDADSENSRLFSRRITARRNGKAFQGRTAKGRDVIMQ